jgi:hypothetical protein
MATAAPGNDTPDDDPTRSSLQLVTDAELHAIGPEDALRIDLSRSASAVRFDDSKGPLDLSRVRIVLATGEVTAADAVARIASRAFGRTISLHQASFRAPDFESLRGFPPDPSGCHPTPMGCCVCGSNTEPCPVLVCVDSNSM